MGRKFFSRNKNAKSPEAESTTSGSTQGSPSPLIAPSPSFVRRVQDSDDLRQVFEKFDANKDGKISLAELDSMLRCLAGGAAAAGGGREEAEAMMKAADLDGDGFISLEEFMSVNKSETDSKKCLEDLRNAFTIFDQDKNGLITAEELHHVLRSIGERKSLADCKSMIKGVDRNGDGAVNFEEFMQMMSRSAKPFA